MKITVLVTLMVFLAYFLVLYGLGSLWMVGGFRFMRKKQSRVSLRCLSVQKKYMSKKISTVGEDFFLAVLGKSEIASIV